MSSVRAALMFFVVLVDESNSLLFALVFYIGIIAGHLYYHLEDVYPAHTGNNHKRSLFFFASRIF
jgi:hypothetical protein